MRDGDKYEKANDLDTNITDANNADNLATSTMDIDSDKQMNQIVINGLDIGRNDKIKKSGIGISDINANEANNPDIGITNRNKDIDT